MFCPSGSRPPRSLARRRSPPGDGFLDEVMRLTNGEGMPVVIEATGNAGVMEKTVDYVAAGGRIVIVGLVKKGTGVTFPGPRFHPQGDDHRRLARLDGLLSRKSGAACLRQDPLPADRHTIRHARGSGGIPATWRQSRCAAQGGVCHIMILGVIADDFTGASDIAAMLARDGMRAELVIGVPAEGTASSADATIVALKSRSIPAPDAVRSHWRRYAGSRATVPGRSSSSTARPSTRPRRAISVRSARPWRASSAHAASSPAPPCPRMDARSTPATCSSKGGCCRSPGSKSIRSTR